MNDAVALVGSTPAWSPYLVGAWIGLLGVTTLVARGGQVRTMTLCRPREASDMNRRQP